MEKTYTGPKSLKDLQFSFATVETKHNYEFQEICADLQKDFGKGVWSLPYKPGFTEYKLKKAGDIARKRGITSLGYLIGIVKKL